MRAESVTARKGRRLSSVLSAASASMAVHPVWRSECIPPDELGGCRAKAVRVVISELGVRARAVGSNGLSQEVGRIVECVCGVVEAVYAEDGPESIKPELVRATVDKISRGFGNQSDLAAAEALITFGALVATEKRGRQKALVMAKEVMELVDDRDWPAVCKQMGVRWSG